MKKSINLNQINNNIPNTTTNKPNTITNNNPITTTTNITNNITKPKEESIYYSTAYLSNNTNTNNNVNKISHHTNTNSSNTSSNKHSKIHYGFFNSIQTNNLLDNNSYVKKNKTPMSNQLISRYIETELENNTNNKSNNKPNTNFNTGNNRNKNMYSIYNKTLNNLNSHHNINITNNLLYKYPFNNSNNNLYPNNYSFINNNTNYNNINTNTNNTNNTNSLFFFSTDKQKNAKNTLYQQPKQHNQIHTNPNKLHSNTNNPKVQYKTNETININRIITNLNNTTNSEFLTKIYKTERSSVLFKFNKEIKHNNLLKANTSDTYQFDINNCKKINRESFKYYEKRNENQKRKILINKFMDASQEIVHKREKQKEIIRINLDIKQQKEGDYKKEEAEKHNQNIKLNNKDTALLKKFLDKQQKTKIMNVNGINQAPFFDSIKQNIGSKPMALPIIKIDMEKFIAAFPFIRVSDLNKYEL